MGRTNCARSPCIFVPLIARTGTFQRQCVRFSEVEFGSRGGEIGADVDQMVGALGALDWRSLAQSTDHGHGPIMSVEGDHYFGHGPIIESLSAMVPKFS